MWEQASLPFAVRGGLISLCNSGPVAVRKQVVCLHDVNTRILPQSYSRKFRALHRVLIPTLGVVAERIATVSHHSADQIRRFGIARPDKIIVVGNGHEHALEWRAAHSPATRAVAGRNTIVVIGTVTPNKNVRLLIGMADQLAQENLQLAVVGATNLRVFGANLTMSQARNVHFLGRISEREIAALLQDSLCLAFPSFVEGFGLPPVEAMALGCPTVVSNTSCLPEICGDAALYASPADANEWHERFVQLRDNPALRRSLVDRGYQRTKTYRWSRSAELYLEAMAQSDRVHRAVCRILQPAPGDGRFARRGLRSGAEPDGPLNGGCAPAARACFRARPQAQATTSLARRSIERRNSLRLLPVFGEWRSCAMLAACACVASEPHVAQEGFDAMGESSVRASADSSASALTAVSSD